MYENKNKKDSDDVLNILTGTTWYAYETYVYTPVVRYRDSFDVIRLPCNSLINTNFVTN
jgi:hypothetical protein